VSKAKIFLACMVWLVILSIGVMLYRLWYVPTVAKQEEQKQKEVLDATSGNSNYSQHIKIGLDGFSGYAILRSSDFNQQLRSLGIKAEAVDDGANYDKRLAALAAGELQLAAFPIDAFLKASSKAKSMPATIIAVIDESRGADAVVAYKERYPTVESLNTAETRFVLVDGSPSDTLTRVLINSRFFSNVTPQAIVGVPNEKELLARYRKATPGGNEVFVTWEPVVSDLLKNEQMKVVFDSNEQTGYIVDALVVSRDYLIKNEPAVKSVLECYFRTLYALNNDADAGTERRAKLKELIRNDAKDAGTILEKEQVDRLVDGIVWKHTQDNFAHFGLGGVATHIEDMIDRVRRVLVDTKGLESDPTQGDSSRLFNQKALRDLQSSGFHAGSSPEVVQGDKPLPVLSDAQWKGLSHVATLQVPPLVFARGTSTLTGRSEAILDDLVEMLKSFPLYYLTIAGNASSKGDLEANRELAKQRAAATLQYLQTKGVPAARMRAATGEITGETSVTFRLGQVPY
jgi:outer membrane protein OmpA-like peptidoglycan-associated protein/ABC-type nitrate/sulfonate/bicarbonate transport system substrate-binding protein